MSEQDDMTIDERRKCLYKMWERYRTYTKEEKRNLSLVCIGNPLFGFSMVGCRVRNEFGNGALLMEAVSCILLGKYQRHWTILVPNDYSPAWYLWPST
jgi:hypothetical protein